MVVEVPRSPEAFRFSLMFPLQNDAWTLVPIVQVRVSLFYPAGSYGQSVGASRKMKREKQMNTVRNRVSNGGANSRSVDRQTAKLLRNECISCILTKWIIGSQRLVIESSSRSCLSLPCHQVESFSPAQFSLAGLFCAKYRSCDQSIGNDLQFL